MREAQTNARMTIMAPTLCYESGALALLGSPHGAAGVSRETTAGPQEL